jgi:acyl-coenzyme A thioesterase PaaI-like protein
MGDAERRGLPDGLHDGHLFGAGQPCFGCSPDHPTGFRLTFTRESDEMITRFTPGPQYQGPPGIMHGGLVSTLADEVAAWTVIGLRGLFGFTASFTAMFAGPVRIGQLVEGRGRLVRDQGRVVEVAVRLVQDARDVFTGEFKFAILDERGAARLLGGEIPEAWRRFSRP